MIKLIVGAAKIQANLNVTVYSYFATVSFVPNRRQKDS
jgi:hypothetical protein